MKLRFTYLPLILWAFILTHCGTSKSDRSAADTIKTTGVIPDTLVTNSQEMILKWKEVSISEFGPIYIFEDKKGDYVRFSLIEIPGFNFQENTYFNTVYSNDNAFPIITLRPEIADTWFTVGIKKEVRELDGEDTEVSIIFSMNPVKK